MEEVKRWERVVLRGERKGVRMGKARVLGGGEEGGVECWTASESASAITCAMSSAVIWAEGRS